MRAGRRALHASIAGMKIAIHHAPDADARGLRDRRLPLALALLAGICFAASVLAFGVALDGYSQRAYPVSVLGARGVAHAAGFNLIGFVIPGALVTAAALRLARQLSTARPLARIGGWIVLFSALAFALLGVFPLQLDDIDVASGRVHVAFWSLWWLTTATGGVLLAAGAHDADLRWRIGGAVLAVLVPWCCLSAPAQWGFALSERVAFALWFAWWLLAALAISRNAASAAGSSPPAPA